MVTSSHPYSVRSLARDSALIIALAAALALVVNLARRQPLPWVQREGYDLLVPCPEPTGEAQELAPDSPLLLDSTTLLIDARDANAFGAWHAKGARSMPFDWLGPPVGEEVKVLAKDVARTGAQRIVVYGDGDDPDSGREWARILSGAHLKNVFFVRGGAPAMQGQPARPKEGM